MKPKKRKKGTPLFLSLILTVSVFPWFTPAVSAETWAELSVDLSDRSPGPIFHGASAALYGLSEPNVPNINTLIPIRPSHILQKAPDGVQHPSGDALRVAEYFFEAGGKNVQPEFRKYTCLKT